MTGYYEEVEVSWIRWCALRRGWRWALEVASSQLSPRSPEWFVATCGDLMPKRPRRRWRIPDHTDSRGNTFQNCCRVE
jgi:hypothetical protein